MLKIRLYQKYQKQLAKLTKKNKPRLKTITYIESLLIAQKPIPSEYNDHPLNGNLSGYYDVHIEPNLILVYTIVADTVVMVALVNHDDLKKLELPTPVELINTMSLRKPTLSVIGKIAYIFKRKGL